jgi:pyruvate dehydrogenase E1 component
MPAGVEEGIVRGMYLLRAGPEGDGPRVQLLGSGAILREVLAAAELLSEDFGVVADVWSVTSFTRLRRQGLEAERWNMLHPGEPPRKSDVEQLLGSHRGPVIASTDHMKAYPDQIRGLVGRRYSVLGTDGYGRSDRREKLREHFEVNRYYVAVAALHALFEDGELDQASAQKAIERYKLDANKPDPASA